MRTQTLGLLICLTMQVLSVCATYGQVSQDDTTILLKAFRQVTSQRLIVYVDTVSAYNDSPDRLLKTIQNGNISDKRNGNSLTLTKAEQDHILTQLGQQTVWSDNLFPNSKRIRTSDMWSYLKIANEKRTKDPLTNYSFVFTFAKPIYIRDNTICFIAWGAMCGSSCGQTEQSFYKMTNGEWTKWITVSSGDF